MPKYQVTWLFTNRPATRRTLVLSALNKGAAKKKIRELNLMPDSPLRRRITFVRVQLLDLA